MAIVTISRQFGAPGRPVGVELARRLGAEYLDRQIVAAVAERAGVSLAEAEALDEQVPSRWQRLAAALTVSVPDPVMPPSPAEPEAGSTAHDRLTAMTRAVIEEAAARGNVVILGRGAAFILRRRPDAVHVQLHAAVPERLRFLMQRVADIPVEEIPADTRPDEASLRDLCESMDARRAAYIRRHYDADWLDAANYDLSIDSGRLDVPTIVDLIELAVRSRAEGARADAEA